MKKSILVIAIIILTAVLCSTLIGCQNSTPLTGTAWSNKEVMTYDITDTSSSAKIGTLTITLENIKKEGDGTTISFEEIGQTFTIKETYGNAKITATALDNDNNVMMQSICLIQGCTSLASYKYINVDGTAKTIKAYYSDKKCHYSINGGEWATKKIKSGYMDNEAVYFALRCQDLDAGYSTTYNFMNFDSLGIEEISAGTNSSLSYDYAVSYNDNTGEGQKPATCNAVVLTKAESPIGKSIFVWYTPYSFSSSESNFVLYNNHHDSMGSYHIPVRIDEGTLSYTLTNVSVNY